jgi:hypothetical protein
MRDLKLVYLDLIGIGSSKVSRDPLWMQKDIYIKKRSLRMVVPFILIGPLLDLSQ